MTRNYAVVDRSGFFGDTTTAYSVHATESAAIRAARQWRIHIPGNPPQVTAMVIRSEGGFSKGKVVYSDTVGSLYPVVWRPKDYED